MEDLKKKFKEIDSFEKELSLLSALLERIEIEKIPLFYSEEFISELKTISNSFLYLQRLDVNAFNLLIDTFDRDYSEKANIIHFIKTSILSQFSETELNYLKLNHLSLTKFFQKNKDYLSYYQESLYLPFKELSTLNRKEVDNFFILKKEYELNYLKSSKYFIFHKEFKSTLIKDSAYNKPVYLGLKHLQQKENNIFMEGPFFSSKATCPKCNSRIIHLLEGVTKEGSVYCCSNLDCKFFITGNFFLKKGKFDLVKFFDIKDYVEEQRNSSHNRIYHTLYSIKKGFSEIDIEADYFTFFYKYQIEENSIGFRLDKIKYKSKYLYLNIFYQKRHSIYNFLKKFLDS